MFQLRIEDLVTAFILSNTGYARSIGSSLDRNYASASLINDVGQFQAH